MAASSGSLNARLTLTGSDDVKRQLEDVGNVGERALGKINEAGHAEGLEGLEHAAEGLSVAFEGINNFTSLGGIAGVFQGIAASVGKFNAVLGAGVTVAAAATAGLFELSEKGAKFASEIKDGATRVGIAANDYASLRFAFEQSAASAEDFEKAMGVILEASQTADDSAENVRKAADKIVNNEERIKAAAEATKEAWRQRQDALKEISIHTADDLSEINLKYQRAREAAAKLDGDKETDARKKADDDRLEAVRLLNKRVAEEQRLANKAYQQEQEKQQRENAKQFQTDLDAYHKALDDASAKALGAVKKFSDLGIALKDSADKARDPAAVFRDIADAIDEIDDPATKSAKAVDLFGRRIGTKLVEALSEGRKALKALEDEAKDLNLIPDTKELDIGKKFDDQIAKLDSVVKAASARFGLAFAPLFGEVVDALAVSLGHAIPAIVSGAETVATALKPIFDDLTQVILGNTDKIKSQFIQNLVKGAQYFGDAMKIVGSVVGDVLGGLVKAFNWLDGIVQSIFGGVSIGGIAGFLVSLRAMLAVVTLIDFAISTLITGPLALLATALGPIITGITAIAAAVGWPVVLIAGLIALIATLLLVDDGWAKFKAGVYAAAKTVAEFIVSISGPLYTVFDNIAAWGKTAWDNVIYWTNYAIGLIGKGLDWVNDKIKAAYDAFTAIFGAPPSAPAPGTSTPFQPIQLNAEGGPISGPGTATSDSILSRLSNGEYVIKARAVRFWGLNLMNSINRMVAPGFAAGGYVDSLAGAMTTPARTGGLGAYQAAAALEGRVSVDLSHNGNTFRGLLAPAAVAASMVRYASSQERVSLGRRSTAFGGGHA